MNGPMKMYPTKQIITHDIRVDLPNCMYKMRNIHTVRTDKGRGAEHVSSSPKSLDISEQVKQFLKNNHTLPEMAALEERQLRLLKELAKLREQMESLKANLNIRNYEPAVKQTSQNVNCPVELNNLPEIVVNASPAFPPYCLLKVQKLWCDVLHLAVKTHLHSSVSSLPESAAKLSEALEKFAPKSVMPKLNLRLIWKKVGLDSELIASHNPILGESNILRYLARVSPNYLNYEALENPLDIDSVLDVCYCLTRAKTKTERSSLLQSLNKRLGKSEWLCGRSKITIADIAASSAIKQVASNEVNVNLTKWLQRCEA